MSVMSLILTVVIILTGKNLLSIFGLSKEAVSIGETFFKTIAVFYIFNGLAMSIKGYLEGMADMLFSGAAGIASLAVRIMCFISVCRIMG